MQAGQLRAWQAASWGVGLVTFQSLAWSHADSMQAGQLRAWQAASWGVGLVAFQSLAWSHAGRTAQSMAGSLMGGGAGGIPVLGLVTCRQAASWGGGAGGAHADIEVGLVKAGGGRSYPLWSVQA